jgi:hypothetical protein
LPDVSAGGSGAGSPEMAWMTLKAVTLGSGVRGLRERFGMARLSHAGRTKARGCTMEGDLLFIGTFFLPFSVFLWGLVGLWLDYYRVGDRILRGNDARVQNLKIIFLSLVLMVVSSLIVAYFAGTS